MPLQENEMVVVAPSPTPFATDDSVDHAAIEHNVGRWLATPLSGFVLNSENGEESFLSEQERFEIIRTVHRTRDASKLLIAGIDCPAATETLRLATRYVEAGADMLRIRIPRLTSVQAYFEEVIPRAPAPVIIIHQMAPGMFLSGPSALGAKAEQIGDFVARDNVYGYIASADIRFESRVRTFIPADRHFWIGNGSLLLPGAVIGSTGACLMLGNVAPRECHDILRQAAPGNSQANLAEAAATQTRLIEADWQILTRGAAGLKAALDLLGYQGGAPRAPSPACKPAEVEQIRQALQQAGLLR